MKATCPTSPEHKRFYTVADVMEEWVVTECGDYVFHNTDIMTIHGPNPRNNWICVECDAQATVVP